MSRFFPISRVIGDYEIGGRVIQETGQIVREFTPSPIPGKYKQYWITKDTGDIYLRKLNQDNSYIWEYVSSHEFNITKAVAQAWVEPPKSDEQLYPRAWGDTDCNAEYIAWFPSLGSSVDIKITMSDARAPMPIKFVKDDEPENNDHSDNDQDMLHELRILPSYTGNTILTRASYCFNARNNVMYVYNQLNQLEPYKGIQTGNPKTHLKYTLPECTIMLYDLRRQIFGIPSRSDEKHERIYKYVRKHGLAYDGLRQELGSRANDNTIISYISSLTIVLPLL